MYCRFCGAKNEEDHQFCVQCGKQLGDTSAHSHGNEQQAVDGKQSSTTTSSMGQKADMDNRSTQEEKNLFQRYREFLDGSNANPVEYSIVKKNIKSAYRLYKLTVFLSVTTCLCIAVVLLGEFPDVGWLERVLGVIVSSALVGIPIYFTDKAHKRRTGIEASDLLDGRENPYAQFFGNPLRIFGGIAFGVGVVSIVAMLAQQATFGTALKEGISNGLSGMTTMTFFWMLKR